MQKTESAGQLKTAFEVGFEKQAAARSEILNTALNPINWPLSYAAAPLGAAIGPYSAKDQREVNKKSWTNLIPGVAPYRLGRRAAGQGMEKDERPQD